MITIFKRLIITIAICLMFAGCVTAPIQPITMCPNETVVITVVTPAGEMYVPIPEGALDDPNASMTMDEFNDLVERGIIRLLPKGEPT